MSAFWIFGYGSLMWRPGFRHEERRPGYLRGWARRFWQGSIDHRGVPGAPGRVVTLVEDASAVTWGTAYRLGAAERERVLAELDHREKGGYQRLSCPIRDRDDAPFAEALVYVAGQDNACYLGEAPIEAIARQVTSAEGPSGANRDYVIELARALRAIEAVDVHVFELEQAIMRRLERAER